VINWRSRIQSESCEFSLDEHCLYFAVGYVSVCNIVKLFCIWVEIRKVDMPFLQMLQVQTVTSTVLKHLVSALPSTMVTSGVWMCDIFCHVHKQRIINKPVCIEISLPRTNFVATATTNGHEVH